MPPCELQQCGVWTLLNLSGTLLGMQLIQYAHFKRLCYCAFVCIVYIYSCMYDVVSRKCCVLTIKIWSQNALYEVFSSNSGVKQTKENVYQFMPFFRCYTEIYSKTLVKRPFDSLLQRLSFFENHLVFCLLDNQPFIDKTTTHSLKNVTIGEITISSV